MYNYDKQSISGKSLKAYLKIIKKGKKKSSSLTGTIFNLNDGDCFPVDKAPPGVTDKANRSNHWPFGSMIKLVVF